MTQSTAPTSASSKNPMPLTNSSNTATMGNPIFYHVPKITGASPIPVLKSSKKTGNMYLAKKKSFLSDNFSEIQCSPIGSNGALPSHRVFTKIDILRCAIDCGYGLARNWTAALAVSPFARPTLSTYLLQRLKLVAACVEKGNREEYLVSPFFEFLEPTEKGDVSFNIGSLGTNLASRIWLKSAGEKIKFFLHAGILDASLAHLNVALAAPGKKSPDYLVGTDKDHWHIFESKGGSASDAVSRIAEGLFQLHGKYFVNPSSKGSKAVDSYVCVHTSVDPGLPLHLQIVDPPGPPKATEQAEIPEPVIQIDFIQEVASLMSLLESIDLFNAMADEMVDITRGPMAGWTVTSATIFQRTSVAMPTVYRRMEKEIRIGVSRFLAVREVQERSLAVHGTVPYKKPLVDSIKNHLRGLGNYPNLPEPSTDVFDDTLVSNSKFYSLIEELEPGKDFLYRCSKVLRIDVMDELAREKAQQAHRFAAMYARISQSNFRFTTNFILLSDDRHRFPIQS